jgi:hypothetical protein
MYDSEGDFNFPGLREPPKDGWDKFIYCGFIL